MPSLVPARLAVAAPPEQLLEALARFTALTAESILAVAAGLLGARLMRRQCLHWSWAAVATALCVLAHRAVGHHVLPLALGGASATWRLHRWQRIDREDGLWAGPAAGPRPAPAAVGAASCCSATTNAGAR
jgi:hypothetical protein